MAYFERRGDRWRVQIRRRGVAQSRTFRTKAQAREWALQAEAGITGETRVSLGRRTVLEALRRYSQEVSPTKRGARWERIRLKAFEVEPLSEFVRRPIADTTEDHIGAWRDARLKEVGPGTVVREMNLLASVFEVARREWKWARVNPFRGVRKPQEPPPRRRGIKPGEFKAIAAHLTARGGREVLAGFELGIETGMRAGEMWSLGREQIDLASRVAHLERTKNGDQRDVALSPRAVDLIADLLSDGRPLLFTITNAVRDTLFRKARAAAGIGDLHFHDSRAEAVSRMSKVLPVLELAAQIGHRDINSLQSYYRPSASERAQIMADASTSSVGAQPKSQPPSSRSGAQGRPKSQRTP